ncbi:MAG TPA: SIMPL domain-containing protein [Pyrinomonadaceae bacterium]
MKRSTILILVLLCSAFSAHAQETDKLSMITVSGAAEMLIAPDEAVFSIDVTKTNKDLPTAKRLNDESVGKILELTRRFSIPPQNVQTAQITVDMKYESIRDAKTKIYSEEGDEIGKRVFKGYEVSKTVTVKLTDLSRFEGFFAEVLQTGATAVNSVRFETSRLRENKDKAREMAMKAAKEKATAMAAAIGQNIGRAIKITEGTVGGPGLMNYAATSNSIGTTGRFTESLVTFAPGAIKIEAQVTVSFQLN